MASVRIKRKVLYFIIPLLISSILIIPLISATPIGPSINVLGNETKNVASSTKINSSINDSITPGGYVFTIGLQAYQQNKRWKAYVGNVTGTLVLDDANDNTIFQWSITTVTGEVYATRTEGTINWTGINCTWIADGKANSAEGLSSNRSPEYHENVALSQTNRDDNITATFRYKNHSSMQIGSVTIGKDECFSLQTWQSDSAQVFSDSDNANFTQVLLYDGAPNTYDGNLVYATEIEDDLTGFDSTETYDFQMILPEVGTASWTGSTAYYFYVELT